MIWVIGILTFLLVAWCLLEARFVDKRLDELNDRVRGARRLQDERWEVAQERHDTVIELIAQIGVTLDNAFAAKPEVKGAPKQKRKKAT